VTDRPITFDDSGFTYHGQVEDALVWTTSKIDAIGLYHYPVPPDIGADLDKVDELRKFYKGAVNPQNTASSRSNRDSSMAAKRVRTLFKAAKQPTGRTYLAALTFPFRDLSYVLKV
jgi:hypothetical protein